MRSDVSRLAVPIMLSVTADSVLSLASLVSVSKLSTADIAAVGLASYLFFIVNAVAAVFTGGVMVTASQALGAGRRDLAEGVADESLSLSVIFALLLAGSSQLWLRGYLYAASQGNPDVIESGYAYSSMRLLSLPALMANAVLSALYRSADRPWPTAASSLTSAAVGVVAIPLLTLGFGEFEGLGAGGAGLASALASYAGLAAYAAWPPPLRLKLKPPGKLALKVVLVGLPVASERIVASLAQNIYINAVARGGTAALAAHNIGLTVEGLVIQPSFAVSMAALIKAGQDVGSGDLNRADYIVKESVKAGAAWMGLAAAILAAVSPFAGRLFTKDEEVAALTMVYLLLAAASEVGLGVSQALFGAIRGMGSVWLPFAISSFTVVFLRALPAQILSASHGAVGAWVTQNTDMYGRAALAFLAWRLLGTRRLTKRVI